MSLVLTNFLDKRNAGVSAAEIRSVFKAAKEGGFTEQETKDLRMLGTMYRDSFTASGFTAYQTSLKSLPVAADVVARLTVAGPEKRTILPPSTHLGPNGDLYRVPVMMDGKAASVSFLRDGERSQLLVTGPNGVTRPVTDAAEARAIATALSASTANTTMTAAAARGFGNAGDFSTQTFRRARISTNADRSLSVTTDQGFSFNLLNGVITFQTGAGRRELLGSEYSSLARAIPYNQSIELNSLFFAASRKAH